MSTISTTNLLKPPKSLRDYVMKSKILAKIIARGSAMSLSVATIISTLKIATVSVVADAFLPVPICCLVFSLAYELIPDSYAVLKKKLLARKKGIPTDFEQSELQEIQMYVNQEIENMSNGGKLTARSMEIIEQLNNEPVESQLNNEPNGSPSQVNTARTIYQDKQGNLFQKIR